MEPKTNVGLRDNARITNAGMVSGIVTEGAEIIREPKVVAAPLPLLDPRNIGQLCPEIAARPATNSTVGLPSDILAIKKANAPFKISINPTMMPAVGPTVLYTFAAPPF